LIERRGKLLHRLPVEGVALVGTVEPHGRDVVGTFDLDASHAAVYDGGVLPEPSSFTFRGRKICYREYGSGPRVVVLTHGLLMDSRMYQKLAPALAARGNRVITVDMLGHGSSAQPYEMTEYSMPQFGRDIVALLDHQQAVRQH